MKFAVETLSDKFFCSELNIKQYKELLKCSFGDEPDTDIFVETLSDILGELLDVSAKQIKQMSVVDILLIVLQLRINSQGDVIKLSVTKDGKQMGLELDLNYVKRALIDLYKPFVNKKVFDENIEVCFNIPSVERFLNPVEDEYLYFLSKAKIKTKSVDIKANSEALTLFNNLPPKLGLSFIEHFNQFVAKCSKTNFLEKYNVEQTLGFVPSIGSLIWYTKLFFSEPLDVFYDNLFYLSHLGHLELSYVETLSPGEYIYMVKKLEHTLSQKSPTTQEQEPQYNADEDFDDSGMFEDQP